MGLQVPIKAGWGAIVGDVRRVASGDGGARPPSMRQSDFARSLPIKEREDEFKKMMIDQCGGNISFAMPFDTTKLNISQDRLGTIPEMLKNDASAGR